MSVYLPLSQRGDDGRLQSQGPCFSWERCELIRIELTRDQGYKGPHTLDVHIGRRWLRGCQWSEPGQDWGPWPRRRWRTSTECVTAGHRVITVKGGSYIHACHDEGRMWPCEIVHAKYASVPRDRGHIRNMLPDKTPSNMPRSSEQSKGQRNPEK